MDCHTKAVETKRKQRACRKDRDRARTFGVDYEPIRRIKVFERDGWICGICSKTVDPTLPGTHERGATLDHIIPISHGGPHLYTNVQLAHRACNVRKSNRMPQQLRLVA